MATNRRSVSVFHRKRLSDSGIKSRASTTGIDWSAFSELYETSEVAQLRRKSAESAKVKIDDNDSSQRKESIQAAGEEPTNVQIVEFASPESKIKRIKRKMEVDSQVVPISQFESTDQPDFVMPKLESHRLRPVPVGRLEMPEPAKITFPKNGLANRLSNLLRQQQSDAAVWHHRMKFGTQIGRSALEVALRKEIYGDATCAVYECEKIPTSESDKALSKIVVFGRNEFRQYGLELGQRVMIFAPYLQLLTDKFLMPVIVGPIFLQV